MDHTDKRLYLPKQRGYPDPQPCKQATASETKGTPLPDPVTDPIVANNIATWEFDYTSNQP